VIAAMVKQRRESIGLFLQGNRPELAAKEEGEISVLERYLRRRSARRRSRRPVREAIAETGAGLPSDMGRVMKALMPKVAGRPTARRSAKRFGASSRNSGPGDRGARMQAES